MDKMIHKPFFAGLTLFLSILFGAGPLFAYEVELTWNAPTTNGDGTALTDLSGYKVYYGTSSGVYSGKTDVGMPTCTTMGMGNTECTYTVASLNSGNYYFAVTAYDSSGNESDYSNEANKTATGGDYDSPANPSVSINGGADFANSTNVALQIDATDNVGVTGYYVSENPSTPSAGSFSTVNPSETSYSASFPLNLSAGDGVKTVYIWFLDAVENISSRASDTITLDATPPSALASSPPVNATDVAITTAVSVTFSEAMDTSTIIVSNFTLSGGITGAITFSADNATATLTPNTSLEYGATYTATATTTVTDLAGNEMTSDYTWTFTMAAADNTGGDSGNSTGNGDGGTGTGYGTDVGTVVAGDVVSGGCFIATAAYGSYLEPHVQVLRDFRDKQLLSNAPGRLLVELYYKYSPPVAAFIAGNRLFKMATRFVLTPIIYGVEYPMLALILLATFSGTIGARYQYRKKDFQ